MSATDPTFDFIHSINPFYYLDSSTRLALDIQIYNLIFHLHSITPKFTLQFIKEVGSVSYWRDMTIEDSNKQIMPMCIIINIRPR